MFFESQQISYLPSVRRKLTRAPASVFSNLIRIFGKQTLLTVGDINNDETAEILDATEAAKHFGTINNHFNPFFSLALFLFFKCIAANHKSWKKEYDE